MKALRFIGYFLLFALIIFVTALTLVVRNQSKIAEIALARIYNRTGLAIRIAGTRVGLGTHLVVILEQPRVAANGVEMATLDDIRAVLSYGAIFRNSGLPLAQLVLDHPRAKVPVRAASATIGGLPRLDTQAVTTLKWALDALSDTALQVDVVDAVLTDQGNASLVEHLDFRTHRSHRRRVGDWPWLVDFDATFNHAQVKGLRLTGSLSLGPQLNQPDLAATGRVWFWGLDLRNFDLGAVKASAEIVGEMKIAFDNTGVLTSHTAVVLRKLLLNGDVPAKNVMLGDYEASTSAKVSPDLLELPDLSLRHGFSTVLVGKAVVRHPFDDARTLSFDLGGIAIDLTRVTSYLRATAGIPPLLIKLADRLGAGQLMVTRLALGTTEPLGGWTFGTLRDNLLIDATIRDAGYQLPAGSQIPSLTGLGAQLGYSAGVLKLIQGSAEIGESQFSNLKAEVNLQNAPGRIPYKLRLKANLDLGQLYPAASGAMRTLSPAVAARVVKLQGRAPLTVDTTGNLNSLQWQTPRSYHATVALGNVTATIKDVPAPIALRDGKVSLAPGLLTVDHVRLVPGGANGGDVTLNGTVEPRPTVPLIHNLTATMRQIPVERWLPVLVSPESLGADGPVSGVLTANSDARGSAWPVVTGKLTLGTGHIKLGFLRSPVVVRSAALNLDGKGLVLDAPGGKLEGAPLDLNLMVKDFAHPVLRIDASADNLDLEAMNFIRLPWSAHTPPRFFAVPAYGHIEARAAKFDKLLMSQVATDFSRDNTTWQVYNFAARVFAGALHLRIAGRTGPDNWIHMVGKIANMDAGSPFLLSGETKQPPITGKLFVDGDLWANTDLDFFNTLGGTVALEAHDGTLNRFTLLTRILSLIDLKSWLTANFPDPRVAGLPFKQLSANLKGTGGDFYTDNLRLDGPAMNISAKGNVRFGDGQIDMELGLFPFNTANWIVHHIPIVGANLANGSKGLVAAYFHVHGSFRNPAVTPKPITSVTEFVKKMLGLPINIIAPNTIK